MMRCSILNRGWLTRTEWGGQKWLVIITCDQSNNRLQMNRTWSEEKVMLFKFIGNANSYAYLLRAFSMKANKSNNCTKNFLSKQHMVMMDQCYVASIISHSATKKM